jgi:thiol-disulfide isomerase/thioredoxin
MTIGIRREGSPRHRDIGVGEPDLPIEGALPSVDGATGWLNSDPLTPSALRGRVVLVQFWTYTCINWLRTEPYIRAWARRYLDHGLVVIGVHTPEFAFEHRLDNVRRAVKAMDITYPVATDNGYRVWQAFGNRYWPALYFVDAEGRIRHHRFGEGDYERSEMVIKQLLAEAGVEALPEGIVSVEGVGAEAAADWNDLGSPETYLGYDQLDGLDSSTDLAPDRRHVYAAPSRLHLNRWALSGDWTVRSDAALLNEAGGLITYQFHARDLHLVMGPAATGASVPFRVLLDGRAAGEAHGSDVDASGEGAVSEQRMYQLVRQPMPVVDCRSEIEFRDSGVEAFVFTFG